YTLALFLFHTLQEEREAMRRFTQNSLLDGLIVTADNAEDPFVPTLIKRGMPFVYVGRPLDPDHVTFVDVDNVVGAYNATTHLIKRGYKRIAQISTAHNTAGLDRDQGYRQALTDRGIELDENLIVYGDFSERSGYEAMQCLLRYKPDAVFIQSDSMAVGACQAIRQAGLHVPHDIAVVGFDDLPPAMQTPVPLTTVRQPIQRTGMIAVETLIDLLRNPEQPPQHIILPTELVIRSSCGTIN
ncbi:MAG: substrate-binding domain-containing protein, partial [Anaerolineae bacterium]|nr:substrate-binding domain-containing protein [Anaerolineae bacterium]